MSRLQQIESSLKAKENELAAKEEDIKSMETKLGLDLQMYTKDLRALEKERESWEKKHAQESARLLEEERKKQLWVAEEEKRIRGILDQHRIQEKETAKRFQESLFGVQAQVSLFKKIVVMGHWTWDQGGPGTGTRDMGPGT